MTSNNEQQMASPTNSFAGHPAGVLERAKALHGIKKKICERLIQDCSSGDRLPPIRDLARELGSGQKNTHRAIQDLVREGFLVSRPKLGTFMSDEFASLRPKLEAVLVDSAPAAQKQPLAGKVVHVLTYKTFLFAEQFYNRAIDPFIHYLTELGATIERDYIDNQSAHHLEPYLKKETHGVMILNPSQTMELKCLPSQVMMVINCGQDNILAMSERYDLVSTDDIQGGLLAGQYFRTLGWEDICYIGCLDLFATQPTKVYDKTSQKRLQGLTLGLGGTIRPECQLYAGLYTTLAGAEVVADWLKITPRPSAIFTASDEVAVGFIHGAKAHRLSYGKDYHIIGFDGQQDNAEFQAMPITTIATPMAEMGSLAAQMLSERLQDPSMSPRRTYLGCSLRKGSTAMSNAQAIQTVAAP